MVVQANRPQIDPYAVLVSAGVAGGSLIALQLFTTADPIGRCVTFWKQLRRQVRAIAQYIRLGLLLVGIHGRRTGQDEEQRSVSGQPPIGTNHSSHLSICIAFSDYFLP
jgi:hypothetical protein